ncbi:MAG: hypothetical protein GTN40_01480 [Candidatus Aenigmarchaeota archaeon]|nr:hypothetical protein [Candidatus Aenigmarchaeota archaeon]
MSGIFDYLTKLYERFLSIFPQEIHWLISLIILIAIVVAFIRLIRRGWIALILLIIFLPIVIPALRNIFSELYQFVVYLWEIVKSGPLKFLNL